MVPREVWRTSEKSDVMGLETSRRIEGGIIYEFEQDGLNSVVLFYEVRSAGFVDLFFPVTFFDSFNSMFV